MLTYITLFTSLLIYLLPVLLSTYNLNTSSKLKNNFFLGTGFNSLNDNLEFIKYSMEYEFKLWQLNYDAN